MSPGGDETGLEPRPVCTIGGHMMTPYQLNADRAAWLLAYTTGSQIDWIAVDEDGPTYTADESEETISCVRAVGSAYGDNGSPILPFLACGRPEWLTDEDCQGYDSSDCLTVYRDETYGHLAEAPEGWRIVARARVAREAECPICGPGAGREDERDECVICEGDGYLYDGEGWAAIVLVKIHTCEDCGGETDEDGEHRAPHGTEGYEVCIDCYRAAAGCDPRPDREAGEPEPLCEIPPHLYIAPGCGTEENTFSHGRCDACGSWLAGSRHRLWVQDAPDLDTMIKAYVECAVWSSEPDDDDEWVEREISPDVYIHARAACESFLSRVPYLCADDHDAAQVGHDLWLTRNGHGAGFWSRDKGAYPDGHGDRLSRTARHMGGVWLYVGDDGAIYPDRVTA